jgi:predicted NAD-dependent protein-ADP-ribosyltransferase YbiA (DUF1768 family)
MNLDIIHFYEGSFASLSNFSAHTVTYNGTTHMTAGHAYQTAEFVDVDTQNKIISAPSAFLAREYGQVAEGRTLEFDKISVMKEIMRAKRD